MNLSTFSYPGEPRSSSKVHLEKGTCSCLSNLMYLEDKPDLKPFPSSSAVPTSPLVKTQFLPRLAHSMQLQKQLFATFLYSAGSAWVRSSLRQPAISSLSDILDTGRVTNHPRLHRTIRVLAQKIWYPGIPLVTLETGITQDLLQCL